MIEPCGMGGGVEFSDKFQKTLPARGKLPEIDTDTITTERNNPTREQKTGDKQVPPTINFSESTQELKTEKISAQRLQMGEERRSRRDQAQCLTHRCPE